jgi:DNA-binding NarL/FixJ family response regulator
MRRGRKAPHRPLELPKKIKPDLAIVDISLKGIDGIELIKILKIRYPTIVALCCFDA